MPEQFLDRTDAGRQLAHELAPAYAKRDDVRVLALPRGGVPVAYEVADMLGAPLDVFVVRKLGVPGHEEYAMGAIASGGVRIVNEDVVRELGITDAELAAVCATEEQELLRREQRYRGEHTDSASDDLTGRTVIVVDDGLATGSTMRVALLSLRASDPARLVVAVPVAPPDTCAALRDYADEVICLETPDAFRSVGEWYRDFAQTSDDEVYELLELSAARRGGRVSATAAAPPATVDAPR
jgi:predicted phosphoribosyltransferase